MKKLLAGLIGVVLIAGCINGLTPAQTVEKFLEHTVNGQYEKAFEFVIDGSGNIPGKESLEEFGRSVDENPISVFEVNETVEELDINLPEYAAFKKTIFNEGKVVMFSITDKNTGNVQMGKLVLVNHKGAWKILFPGGPGDV